MLTPACTSWGGTEMPSRKSRDELVGELVIQKILQDSEHAAEILGPPAGMTTVSPKKEIELWNATNPEVDVLAIMRQRLEHHLSQGLPAEDAYIEASLETAAVAFPNRLKQVAHLPTLTQQCAELERLAQRAERAKASTRPLDDAGPPQAPPTAPQSAPQPPSSPADTGGAAAVQPEAPGVY